MKVNNAHLTYCTNIHKNKTLKDTVNNIKKYAINIKNKVSPNNRFGIGLCLSYNMSLQLVDETALNNFKHWLSANNLYIFTINGFVHSYFHKKNIKEKIYEPDWGTVERFIFTKNLITILSNLLDTEYGSISTVPICYKIKIRNRKKKYRVIQESLCYLMEILVLLDKTKREKNKKIVLCFEPEPDCFLENTHDIIFFYKHTLIPYGTNYLNKNYGYTKKNATRKIFQHLQICYDACHFAIQHEKPKKTFEMLLKHNITVGKVQLSSLVHMYIPRNTFVEKIKILKLQNLSTSTFLHQVRTTYKKTKNIHSCVDFSKPINSNECLTCVKKTRRIHYHLPIYKNTFLLCNTTKKHLDKTFLELIRKNVIHLEIETYTWLAAKKKNFLNTVESIVKEYEYVTNFYNKIKITT